MCSLLWQRTQFWFSRKSDTLFWTPRILGKLVGKNTHRLIKAKTKPCHTNNSSNSNSYSYNGHLTFGIDMHFPNIFSKIPKTFQVTSQILLDYSCWEEGISRSYEKMICNIRSLTTNQSVVYFNCPPSQNPQFIFKEVKVLFLSS